MNEKEEKVKKKPKRVLEKEEKMVKPRPKTSRPKIIPKKHIKKPAKNDGNKPKQYDKSDIQDVGRFLSNFVESFTTKICYYSTC